MSRGPWKKLKSETNQKRDKVVSFRVSRKENELLHELANQNSLSLADYILMNTVYSEREYTCVDIETLTEMYAELCKADVNFNQATRALNTAMFKKSASKEYKDQIAKALKIITKEHKLREETMRNINKLSEQTFRR